MKNKPRIKNSYARCYLKPLQLYRLATIDFNPTTNMNFTNISKYNYDIADLIFCLFVNILYEYHLIYRYTCKSFENTD